MSAPILNPVSSIKTRNEQNYNNLIIVGKFFVIIFQPTPYVCPLPSPFFPGQMVRIRGCAAPNGDRYCCNVLRYLSKSFYYRRFDINFQTRETTYDTDDIAFHISVRLLQGYIARNSFRDGDWEEEEDYGDLPIMPGQHFEILILCEPTQFKVCNQI